MTRRVHIDRLDLDFSGIPPATAEAAARLLGPALERALGRKHAAPAAEIDAGRIAMTGRPDAQALATQMAGRIARQFGDER
jgi:hypothetical protein